MAGTLQEASPELRHLHPSTLSCFASTEASEESSHGPLWQCWLEGKHTSHKNQGFSELFFFFFNNSSHFSILAQVVWGVKILSSTMTHVGYNQHILHVGQKSHVFSSLTTACQHNWCLGYQSQHKGTEGTGQKLKLQRPVCVDLGCDVCPWWPDPEHKSPRKSHSKSHFSLWVPSPPTLSNSQKGKSVLESPGWSMGKE